MYVDTRTSKKVRGRLPTSVQGTHLKLLLGWTKNDEFLSPQEEEEEEEQFTVVFYDLSASPPVKKKSSAADDDGL